ncbi:M10 family metallopeptidase [Phaeobacter sp. QD34_3]|uniref:M10 family metallopeptidase n=1 Tax=unclassified Phaeobacter TaxID=2621772 RepID=UPI00237F7951|nr:MULTISPECIES: M10 family metallopeptidase [unclassified Phaeobacter]MDE4131938.1 M10 family metallopeptidase [Phaeobacter sp. QD34_3]MDE4135576.1 M10 family metallopeptidase [Phaeobacter sp. QD34_24]
MLSPSEIIRAMQFDRFYQSDPVNLSSSPRMEITYQYAGTQAPEDLPTGVTYSGWRDFTVAEQANFEAALAHIETFLNVEFIEVSGQSDPDINVGAVTLPGSTTGYGGYSVRYSGTTITQWDGYVVFDETLDLSADQYMNLLLHEMGHAMGLRHTFDDDSDLPSEYDSNLYSVMSYTANPNNGQDSDAMMLFDVLALQDIWGSAAFNAGDTTYTGSRTATVDAIWDSGGQDMISVADRTSDVVIDLRQGSFSSIDAESDVVITFGTVIEDVRAGVGNDRITGNTDNNYLYGNIGNDTVYGGRGGDHLVGGSGRDRLYGEGGRDSLVGDSGRDQLRGGAGADTLSGGVQRDRLFGGAGNDTLAGGGGNDVLNGQAGNDVLYGGRSTDTFVFANTFGNDTIRDFDDGLDTIKIRGHGDLSAVLAAASDTADGALFDFGSDTLLVRGVSVSDLSDDILV